jgi:YfiH family protein
VTLPGVRHLVTDRSHLGTVGAGVLGESAPPYDRFNLGGHVGDDPGAVAANRQGLLDATGADALVWMRQVHGDSVATVRAADRSPEADAMVTDVPGLVLGVLVADCVPVLLADAEAGVVAVAHAGREGVRRGVVDRTLEAMADLGADPARVHVLLGPAVCGACYEVPAGLRDAVEAAVPGSATTSNRGTPALDLRGGLAAQLAERVARVTLDPACTVEDPAYFSYRRDGQTGRFAGVIWLTA